MEAFIKKHTKEDGSVDYKAAQEDFQNQWNGYDAKQKEKLAKQLETAGNEGVNKFIGELGIENVSDKDGFKKYTETLKSTAGEKDSVIAELNEKYKNYDELTESLAKAKGDIFTRDVKTEIGTKFGKDYVDDVYDLIQGKITEEKTAEILVKEYAENDKYQSWLNQQKPTIRHRKTNTVKPDENDKKPINPYKKFW